MKFRLSSAILKHLLCFSKVLDYLFLGQHRGYFEEKIGFNYSLEG
uniref:Uncharacterized protein n=2 Tax=Klebsiella pneumoniae TaxID=573 RepID=A0A175D161_KLEPN|nr:hypothetical protein [Klebsiella pneumoniae]QHW10181.1 hypothetical protein [Enterobacteriaceae bacterium]QXV91308.1 hypothetical protein [Klebsiella pneumoniae subsp. pneumoniae]UIX51162.1 hypothetical protein [Providencia rettgeri]CQR91618.1 hypothetical protein BN1235_p79 [Acinetobacter baumannii]